MPLMPLSLSVAPRVIFDLRDGYASRFTAPLITDGAGGFIRSVARVTGRITIIAEPGIAATGWPFTQPMELVTQESSEGIRAFHGRLRNSGGVLLQRTACRITHAATCQLRIMARGFVPYVIPSLTIPEVGAAPIRLAPIELTPALDYPFLNGNHTVLYGSVLRQGRPVPLATVTVSSDDEPLLAGQVVTNALGEWTFYGDPGLVADDPENNSVEIQITVNGQPSLPEQMAHIGEINRLLPSLIP